MPNVSRSQTVPRAAPPVYLDYAATTPVLFRMWLPLVRFVAPKECCCMWMQYTEATHGIQRKGR